MAENNDFLKSYICIQYPGIVNNADKAINTLGGISSISKAHSVGNRRLELRFRPEDAFSKAACSTKHHTSALLLKVRVKKKKKDNTSHENPKIIATEVMGVIRTIYKFESLSDFQYLPLEPDEEGGKPDKLICIHDKLVPEGLPDPDWLSQPAPFFLVPAIFSRMDTPQTLAFRTGPSKEIDDKHPLVIGKMRKQRLCHATFTNFNHTDPVPSKPNHLALASMNPPPEEHIERVQKLFESQPIWSKIALLFVSKLSNNELKVVLPRVAYYYLTGPWRILWVKFGCDPRKDPHCRIYQTIDFRVRSSGGLKSFVKASRHSDALSMPFKSYQQARIKGSLFNASETDNSPVDELKEDVYIFRPNILPPRRQMFYQYCNLKVSEIEDMLARLGEVLPGALCHERRGWMPAGFEDQCRTILNKCTAERMRQLVVEKQLLSLQESVAGDEEDINEDEQNDDDIIEQAGDTEDMNEDEQIDDDIVDDAELSEFVFDMDDENAFQENDNESDTDNIEKTIESDTEK